MEAASSAPDRDVDESAGRLTAIKRAVPLSRMLDYGVTADDGVRLAALALGATRDANAAVGLLNQLFAGLEGRPRVARPRQRQVA